MYNRESACERCKFLQNLQLLHQIYNDYNQVDVYAGDVNFSKIYIYSQIDNDTQVGVYGRRCKFLQNYIYSTNWQRLHRLWCMAGDVNFSKIYIYHKLTTITPADV